MTDPMKPGSRWQSVACKTQIVVVRAPVSPVDLRCGGAPMIPADSDPTPAQLDSDFADGTVLGKRYTDAESAIEVLCVTPGEGSLAIENRPLTRKEAKPLPSSD